MLCQNCDTSFKPTREWQLFCCRPCKRSYNYANKEVCFYCGEPGVDRDHIHPVCLRGDSERRFQDQETVFSCKECNNILNGNFFSDIIERLTFLVNKFILRYELDKIQPVWTDEDIGELGRELRLMVKRKLKARQDAERRLLYMQAVAHKLLKSTTEEV